MNVVTHFGIDLDTWADYWDLVEEHGLNTDVIRLLSDDLESPILVMGSGQGLVSARCAALGHRVWSVDKSAAMAERALRRRRIPTIVGDAFDVEFAIRFRTVIVTSGIVNERTLAQSVLARLRSSLQRLLTDDGRLVLSYFRRCLWTDVATELGLYGRPSSNVLFWRARGDLPHAEHLFADAMVQAGEVHRIFCDHDRLLARHQDFVTSVGQRHRLLVGREPDQFIADHSGYYPFPLRREAEREVELELDLAGFSGRTLVANGGDTVVHVCRRHEGTS